MKNISAAVHVVNFTDKKIPRETFQEMF